jgi:hypothetical protein
VRKTLRIDESFLANMPYAGSHWRVLMALAFHHDVERGAFPKMVTLARLTGLDRTTVSRAIAELKAADLIREERDEHANRVWRLPVNDTNYLHGGENRWNQRTPRADDALSHTHDASLHRDDAASHKDDVKPHTKKCENAAPIYNTRARSEVSPKYLLKDLSEVTQLAGAGSPPEAPLTDAQIQEKRERVRKDFAPDADTASLQALDQKRRDKGHSLEQPGGKDDEEG